MANVLLLATMAIPHHHHHTPVFIVGTQCEKNDLSHPHDPSENKHDGDDDKADCLLKQIIFFKVNQPSRSSYHYDQPVDFLPDFYDIIQFHSSLIPETSGIMYYPEFICHGPGDRSPPVS